MGDASIPEPASNGRNLVVMAYNRELPQPLLEVLGAKFPDADFEYHRVDRGADLPSG